MLGPKHSYVINVYVAVKYCNVGGLSVFYDSWPTVLN